MLYSSEKYILGCDLGIKTGSLIQAQIDREHNLVERWRILCSWDKGPSIKDPLDSILEFFDRYVFKWVEFDIAPAIAIDWNQREIYWSANKAHTNIKTFVAGCLFNHASERGIITRFISPSQVRSFFGYTNSKVPKHEVQRNFLSMPRVYGKEGDIREAEDHDLDALILAYILDLQLRAEACPEICLARNHKDIWACK